MAQVLAERPAVDFFEVHPENYVLDRSEQEKLAAVRKDYPLSLHGVGLSLGSVGGLNADHLRNLRALIDRLDPTLVSDHLSWSTIDGVYLNDLLPLPYTEEALMVVARHVERAQEVLGRRLLIENPSAYLSFEESEMSEPEFLRALVARTGCGLLLDVNNVFVSASNLGFDASSYLRDIPFDAVGEIHLSGHCRNEADGTTVLIDDHGSAVSQPVWALYGQAITRAANVPTLIEWDSNIPALEVLLKERDKALKVARHARGPRKPAQLETIQQRMANALLAREPEEWGLETRGHLSVYRNNVRESLLKALRTVYPAVATLAGDDFFRQLSLRFIETSPPRAPYVAGYGAEFIDFIDVSQACATVPYLADVARLEWAASRAGLHDAAPALSASHLTEAARSGVEHLVFEPQPGISYLHSPYPIDAIWSFARAGGEGHGPSLDEGQVYLEILYDAGTLVLRRLEEAEFSFRQKLAARNTLAEAAEAAIRIDSLFDLSAALRFALRDGIFTRCMPPSQQPHFKETQPCQL